MFISASQDRGPTDDFWYQRIGQPTLSGQRVNEETALALTAVYSCVKLLSETVGQLPFAVFRRLDRGKEMDRSHPLYRILHDRPNRWQSSIEWRMMMQMHFELRGAGYSEIVYGRSGEVLELVPLHPDKVEPEYIRDNSDYRYKVTLSNNRIRYLSRDQVFAVRGMTWDGLNPINPIEAEREAIGYGLGAQEYGATFYKNGASPPGWIGMPEGASFQNEAARRNFQNSWQTANSGANKHKTPVLDKGMEYHELGIKHTDMQYLETTKKTQIDVCQIFRVPLHKIFLMDGAKFNNVEQMGIDFVQDTMLPRLSLWEQAALQLFDADEQQDYFAEFNVAGLLRADSNARKDFYHAGVTDGWLTRNEVREMENRNPLDGLDEPLTPMNMAESVGRADAMNQAAAERCVTRLCCRVQKAHEQDAISGDWTEDFFTKHAEWVSKVLCLPLSAAAGYCIDLEMQLLESDDVNALCTIWKETGVITLMELIKEVGDEDRIAA